MVTLAAGALAAGRRLPRFRLNFFAPLTGNGLTRKLTAIDLSPNILTLQWSKQSDGGDNSLTVAYEPRYTPNNEEDERHMAWLENPGDMQRFSHVTVTEGEGSIPLWQGRIMLLERPAGWLSAFQAVGYAYTALQDNPFQSSNPATDSSGNILRTAIASAAPIMGIDETAFTDPGVQHAYNSFGGYTDLNGNAVTVKYPRELLNQFLSEGNTLGQQLLCTCYSAPQTGSLAGKQLLSLMPNTAPSYPDYRLDFTRSVIWKEDLTNTYGAIYVLHTGGTAQPVYVNNPLFSGSFSGLSRTAYINGGNLDDAGAYAFGQTFINANAGPAVACSFTVGGVDSGNVEGMRRYGEGTRAPWLVRPGEWCEVADQGTFPVANTTWDAVALVNTVSLGEQDFGQARTVRKLRQSAAHFANGSNPITGAKAF